MPRHAFAPAPGVELQSGRRGRRGRRCGRGEEGGRGARRGRRAENSPIGGGDIEQEAGIHTVFPWCAKKCQTPALNVLKFQNGNSTQELCFLRPPRQSTARSKPSASRSARLARPSANAPGICGAAVLGARRVPHCTSRGPDVSPMYFARGPSGESSIIVCRPLKLTSLSASSYPLSHPLASTPRSTCNGATALWAFAREPMGYCVSMQLCAYFGPYTVARGCVAAHRVSRQQALTC